MASLVAPGTQPRPGGRVIIQRYSILKKGLILIAIPLLFQLGFIGLMVSMRRDSVQGERWTIHTKEVIALVERCRSRLIAAHGAVQGQYLTGQAEFRDQFDRLDRLTRDRFEELGRKVADNPVQLENALALGRLGGRFLDYLIEGSALIRDGRMGPALAQARRQAAQGKLNELDLAFEGFLAEEQRLFDRRLGSLAETGQFSDRVLYGGILASLLISVTLARLFARNIGERIAGLTENTYRLAHGQDLAPPIGGGDEIARLDRVFHDMASTLALAAKAEREHAEALLARADELADVVGQLHEKAQENEMFVYSVSHDLRSPLVNLQGFSKELAMIGVDLKALVNTEGVPQSVRDRAGVLIDREMGESIGFIKSAVTRLSAIIDALLRLSRAGRVEYRRQEVQVGPLVARIISALRGTIASKDAKVVVEPLPSAFGDPTAIEQVFANLIGNALNYLDPTRTGLVVVRGVETDDPGMVVLAVEDNGLGIPDRYRDKIFTAFQRLHGDIAKGEGIGLALVRRVVERHDGRIWFESEVGRGTTFYVALPSRDAEAPLDRPGPRPASAGIVLEEGALA